MQLNIDQALQQAIAAHKEGNLNQAEQIYRAILRSQPKHADANHNLGVIAFSLNQFEAAAELFKSALESNPNLEQFWLNYVNALAKADRLKEARQVIKRAKKKGFDVKRLEKLLSPARRSSEIDAEGHFNLGNTLFGLGKPKEAEASYNLAIALKPNYAEAHNNLGVALEALGRANEALANYKKAIALTPDYADAHYNFGNALVGLGRISEAEVSYERAIALKPDYAEAHNNLGNTLKALFRLKEAKASYSKAIALKPDYAEAHNNLGATLTELGLFEEAELSCNRAIALKPDYADAHNNLGITLKELGRLMEAAASYNEAIELKPDHPEAHNNLGATLEGLGRLKDAEASYNRAIALKPDYAQAMLNLSITQRYMNDLVGEITSLQNILKIGSDDFNLRADVNLAICKFLEGDFIETEKHLLAAAQIQEKISSKFENDKVYWRYLSNILRWRKGRYDGAKKRKDDNDLYVIGESHSLASHHLRIRNSGENFFCSARLIKGCKQWHLGNAVRNQFKQQFEAIFLALPKRSDILLAIGEIDCRLDTGIIAHSRKFPEKEIKEIITNTIENYLAYIVTNNAHSQHKVTIQGVPCPNIDIRNRLETEIDQLTEVIKVFNSELKTKSKENGFAFLDVYQLTNNGDGMSNGSWHIDGYHLSPDGMQEAWRQT